MSTQILSLLLPSDFTVPKDLKSTTPDENAFIVKAGYHAFLSYDNDKAIHNDKSFQEQLEALKAKLENERLQREEQLKKQHAAELAAAKSAQASAESAHAASEAALKKQVASAQATAESARAAQAATNASAAQAEAAARKRAQDDTAEQIRRLEQERERVATELKMERERAAAEREKLLLAERETRERAQKREDDLRAELDRARSIKSCPALKGAANESVMTELLTRAFGGDFLDKQLNAGDHLMRWEGFKLMIEDKTGYLDGVPEAQVAKAHNDFVRHRDCDALLFFSAESSIKGHTRPGDFDVGVCDGRPALYIGKLNAKEDKVLFLQTLQPVIRELIKLTKKAVASGIDASDALKDKLSVIRMLLKNHETQVAAVRNSANAYARTQKSAWEMHKMEIAKMEASFASLLKEALTDDIEEEPTDELEELSEPMLVMPAVSKPTAPKKETVCGACKQIGHNKSNSKCPMKNKAV